VPFLRVNDATVFYDLTGPTGAPIVAFGNSLGTSVHVWDAVCSEVSAAFRVLRFDMRGHGLTDLGPQPSMRDLAGDAVALFDALAIERVTFVGLSIGGMIGQQLAIDHPSRVAALVLCATAARIGTPATWNERIAAVEASGTAGIATGVLARWFTPATHAARPELIAGFANMLARTPATGYAGACAAIRDADLTTAGAAITAPTLVISGSEDVVTPPTDGRAIATVIPGARATTIDGAAHIVPAERPAEFLDLLLPFLRDPLARAAA
jgi:3-oxoadipate enol-lactonase